MLLLALLLIISLELLLGLRRIPAMLRRVLLLLWILLGLPMLLWLAMRLRIVFFISTSVKLSWHVCGSSLQIDIQTTSIALSGILQAQFLTHLLDAWFYLLDVPWRMVTFSDNAGNHDVNIREPQARDQVILHVKVCLPCGLGISNPLLQDVFGLLHELPV